MNQQKENIEYHKTSLYQMLRMNRNVLVFSLILGLPLFCWSWISTDGLSLFWGMYFITVLTWILILIIQIGLKNITKSLITFLRVFVSGYLLLSLSNVLCWISEIVLFHHNVWFLLQSIINGTYALILLIFSSIACYTLFINKQNCGKFQKTTIFLSKALNCFLILQTIFSILSFITWLFYPNGVPVTLKSLYQFLYPIWWFPLFGFTNLLVSIIGIRATVNWNLEWLESFPQFVTDKERERYRKQQNINKKSNM